MTSSLVKDKDKERLERIQDRDRRGRNFKGAHDICRG
jgi:hypothetical protein